MIEENAILRNCLTEINETMNNVVEEYEKNISDFKSIQSNYINTELNTISTKIP